MALKPNGIPKRGSLDDAVGQLSKSQKPGGLDPVRPMVKEPAKPRGGGSAVTRGSAPKVTSAPGRTAAGKNFDQSFAAARRAGLDQFTWNGKKYTTKVK